MCRLEKDYLMAFRTKRNKLTKSTGYFYEGKEIVLTKQLGRPKERRRQHRRPNGSVLAVHRGSWWSDEKKLECATVYAVTRDFRKVEELTGVYDKTLRQWSQEPWWHEIISKVVQHKNEQLDAKITETLDLAIDKIKDRVENGDIVINRSNGTQYRVPVRARDLAVVADIIFDKRQLLRGEATSRSEQVTHDQKLLKLKENFERLAKSKLINPFVEPLEGETSNAEVQQELESEASAEQEKQTNQTTEEGVLNAEGFGTETEAESQEEGLDRPTSVSIRLRNPS